VKKQLAPMRVVGPQSDELGDDNPLVVPQIRALEFSTKLADIVLLQFVRGDLGLFNLSTRIGANRMANLHEDWFEGSGSV